MFARFFVDHPIFANVIAILTMVVGGLCIFRLPVEQFPQITPPTIQVSTTYPGADSQVVADTVAAPIEQQVNGVEGMMYMSSNCANDGSYGLTVTFEVGTDLNMAQVLVQNRVAIAMPQLPPDVQRQGIVTKKAVHRHHHVRHASSPKDKEYEKIYDNDLPRQLRQHPHPRRTQPPAGRGRHVCHSRQGLQHARLAGPGEAPGPRADDPGRDERHSGAEHPSPRRPGGPTARRKWPELPVHRAGQGPAGRGPASSKISSSRTRREAAAG